MKIEEISPGYERYLKDESRVEGKAETICFPETVSDVVEAVRKAYKEKVQITVQGTRTGLTGAAVPEKGSILNFSKMKGELKFNEDGSLYAEAGVTLKEIHDYLRKSKVCFLPNPTEDTAAIGGMFGCNAMGIDGRDTASSVLGLRWINGKGDLWEIKRGSYIFDKQGCQLPDGTYLDTQSLSGKGLLNGFIPVENKDLIDFLAGSEGFYGTAVSFDLKLIDKPSCCWGILYFMETEEKIESLCEQILKSKSCQATTVMEYYDEETLKLLRENRETQDVLKALPAFSEEIHAGVYVELTGDDEAEIEENLLIQLDLFEALGGQEEESWAASESYEIEKFRKLRHLVPELANTKTDRNALECPEVVRMAADFKGAAENGVRYCKWYREDLKAHNIEGIVFGAIAENRLHINLFPKNKDEIKRGHQLIKSWAGQVLKDGGSIVTENGMGIIKKALVSHFLGADVKKEIHHIKEILDPELIFKGAVF